ncbi:hypothetical protein ABN763_00305 [Spongiivirga sp. MCCC 1A20706]|uniref:hypothetical protein n=1 Tax=Spongiivirga sp. MCCC 1A20706 TaxID=3160963 RepID=UPI003977DED5
MKKQLFFLIILVTASFQLYSQDEVFKPTEKGRWLIEANTNFGTPQVAQTSFSFTNTSGSSFWSLGAEGGYFVADNLAVKLGLGYFDSDDSLIDASLSYKVGLKYYLKEKIPIQIDFSGDTENNAYFGVQAGYAFFVNNNISIEPGLRFNGGINEFNINSLQLNIGFALHF